MLIEDVPKQIAALEKEMFAAAKEMKFEDAAKIRDEIFQLRKFAGFADSGRTLIKPPKKGKDFKARR